MAENQDNNPNSVRILQKVRSEFINRTAEQDDTVHNEQIPVSKLDNKAHIIDPHIGIAEIDGNIVLGAQYLNEYFFVNSVRVEQHPHTRTVALNLQKREEFLETSWKSTVDWLESTGDNELTTWAQKIALHYTTFPQIMRKYFELVSSGDPKIYANLRKAKSRAVLACREIESKYEYLRLVLFSNKEAITPLSVSYSEQLVKMMGHDVESFSVWAKSNGIPKVSAGNTIGHKDICKSFLECISFSEGPVWEGPEFQSFVYGPDGSKQDQVIQFFSISEPTRDGLFITNYHIMREAKVHLDKIISEDTLPKEDLNDDKIQKDQDQIKNDEI